MANDIIDSTMGDGVDSAVVGKGNTQHIERGSDQHLTLNLAQGKDLTELILQLSILLHELKATTAAETRLQATRITALEEEMRLQRQRVEILEKLSDRERSAVIIDRRIGLSITVGLFTLAIVVALLAYGVAT